MPKIPKTNITVKSTTTTGVHTSRQVVGSAKTRKNKLVCLKKFVDLETGKVDKSAFEWENALYEKSVQKKALDSRIAKCRLCDGLNIKRFTECAFGYGDLNARVFFIGQSLHKPGVVSGLPFILGSGYILDAALRLSGLLRKDVFITNVIHCHPDNNRATTDEEKQNCLFNLLDEVQMVKPILIVALGSDAKWVCEELTLIHECSRVLKVTHPASFAYGAPEQRIDWILKLSLNIDKVYKDGV